MDKSVIAAFSEEHASKLTGVSLGQLRYWNKTKFYQPSFHDGGKGAFARIYSFQDIVALRVLNVLRNQYSVPLQHLRDTSIALGPKKRDKWTGVKLYVLNRRVIWIEPNTAWPQEVASKQYVMPSVVLDTVIADTKRDVAKLIVRDVAKQGVIERSRHINHNAATIAGTRIPVGAIKRFAAAGYTAEQIIKEYPSLTVKDVEAAIAYEESRVAA